MSIGLKGQHFLKLLDLSPEQIGGLIDLATELKEAECAIPAGGIQKKINDILSNI